MLVVLSGRHDRLPRTPGRVVAAVVLPRGRLELPDRPRHRSAERLGAHPDHLSGAGGDHYLCVHRFARRRGDRAGSDRRACGPNGGGDGRSRRCATTTSSAASDESAAASPRSFATKARSSSCSTSARRRRRRPRRTGVLFIEGNGTDDDDLREAGIERARGLVAASDDDADNLYIALSARVREPEPSDRRARVDRRRGEEAATRRRRPHRPALPGGRACRWRTCCCVRR